MSHMGLHRLSVSTKNERDATLLNCLCDTSPIALFVCNSMKASILLKDAATIITSHLIVGSVGRGGGQMHKKNNLFLLKIISLTDHRNRYIILNLRNA